MRLFNKKTNHYKQIMYRLLLLSILTLLIQGCGTNTQSASSDATLIALSQAIAGTATAEKAKASNAGVQLQTEATQK
jgi:uncharacterized protein YcfL